MNTHLTTYRIFTFVTNNEIITVQKQLYITFKIISEVFKFVILTLPKNALKYEMKPEGLNSLGINAFQLAILQIEISK